MGIFWAVTIIILMTAFILLKKTNKKQNIIHIIIITFGLLLCHNDFLCFILTFFKIPITLLILSLINLVVSFLLFIPIIKNKTIQSFSISKIDLLFIFLIITFILIILKAGKISTNSLKYEGSDSSRYYIFARTFAKSKNLLIDNEDYIYGNFSLIKTMSYVNSGLIMKAINGTAENFDNYKIFVSFSIFILIITAIEMYLLLTKNTNKKSKKTIAFIFSLLYTLGYPLNSFIYGFEYLSVSLLIICLIFDVINSYNNEKIRLKFFTPILFLLNFRII